MPHSFSQAQLFAIISGLSEGDTKAGLQSQMDAVKSAAETISIAYSQDHVELLPLLEKVLIGMISSEGVMPNLQLSASPLSGFIKADKILLQLVLTIITRELSQSVKDGNPVSLHINRTDDSEILEIKAPEASGMYISRNNQLLNICQKIMEDMGGEMMFLLNENGKYFRLRFPQA